MDRLLLFLCIFLLLSNFLIILLGLWFLLLVKLLPILQWLLVVTRALFGPDNSLVLNYNSIDLVDSFLLRRLRSRSLLHRGIGAAILKSCLFENLFLFLLSNWSWSSQFWFLWLRFNCIILWNNLSLSLTILDRECISLLQFIIRSLEFGLRLFIIFQR